AMPSHRRGAMTTQMALRRRNPKGVRHFAGVRRGAMKVTVATDQSGRRMQNAGHDTRIHFSAACSP
ncbi:MAG: hypothetical protein WAU32_11220, partial [Thermoanaerobaculia bacterium]